MYLEKNDYQIRIRIDLLDILLENIAENSNGNQTPQQLLASANKIAVDTISSKVGVLYNIGDELNNTGNQRNGYLLALALSIGLYELYQRSDDEEIPEKVVKNYNDAMNALDAIAKGKEFIVLPPKTSENENPGSGDGETAITQGTGLRRIGSAKKRTHYI